MSPAEIEKLKAPGMLLIMAKSALPRLLEERERLLEALHDTLDHALKAGCRGYLGEDFFARIRDAVDLAEAPTSKDPPTT